MLNDLLFLAAPIERWLFEGPPAAQTVLEAWPLLLVFLLIAVMIASVILRARRESRQIQPIAYDFGDRPRETLEIRARRAGE